MAVSTRPKVAMAVVMAPMLPRSQPRADPVRKIARTIAAMLAAEAVFTEGRQAVIDRASAVIDADTLDEPASALRRRRLLRRRAAPANANLPNTSRTHPIRRRLRRGQPRRARRRIGRGFDGARSRPPTRSKPRSPNSNRPLRRNASATTRRACLLDSGPIPTSTSRRSTRSPAPPRISPPSWRSRCT